MPRASACKKWEGKSQVNDVCIFTAYLVCQASLLMAFPRIIGGIPMKRRIVVKTHSFSDNTPSQIAAYAALNHDNQGHHVASSLSVKLPQKPLSIQIRQPRPPPSTLARSSQPPQSSSPTPHCQCRPTRSLPSQWSSTSSIRSSSRWQSHCA
ncbi:hypothetical protein IWX90DRAFT_52484 [Phyllosticta citrichinensis]|uniref:Uncharacterized protein n=1 Tax=Phyllosticta citrichinensis TaxID=1130410 RepID=A0ABR1XIS4_9PEZI